MQDDIKRLEELRAGYVNTAWGPGWEVIMEQGLQYAAYHCVAHVGVCSDDLRQHLRYMIDMEQVLRYEEVCLLKDILAALRSPNKLPVR